MPAGIGIVLWWPAMPAVVISLVAGLGIAGPAPHAVAGHAGTVGLFGSSLDSGVPVAYVVNQASGTVTPVNTTTNTAGPPIPVGGFPGSIAITPDDKTAYVTVIDFYRPPKILASSRAS
jgi:DNA-binding beta-propeller fold protein YncE